MVRHWKSPEVQLSLDKTNTHVHELEMHILGSNNVAEHRNTFQHLWISHLNKTGQRITFNDVRIQRDNGNFTNFI